MDHMEHHHHAAEASPMDMDMDMCSMNMLFTWNTKNLCIVFRWWHVRSTLGLIVSLLAVVAFSAGYEAVRAGIRRYETRVAQRTTNVPQDREPAGSAYRDNHDPQGEHEPDAEIAPFLRTDQAQIALNKRAHVVKAVLYGLQNFYAFMIMLIFMTYNGWVMIAVSLGATLGYLVFGESTTATKETACH